MLVEMEAEEQEEDVHSSQDPDGTLNLDGAAASSPAPSPAAAGATRGMARRHPYRHNLQSRAEMRRRGQPEPLRGWLSLRGITPPGRILGVEATAAARQQHPQQHQPRRDVLRTSRLKKPARRKRGRLTMRTMSTAPSRFATPSTLGSSTRRARYAPSATSAPAILRCAQCASA